MSNNYINSACFRYVVPFKFEESFEEAVKKIESREISKKSRKDGSCSRLKLWERIKESSDGSESDLYDYIKNEFRIANGSNNSDLKSGCEWILRGSNESTSDYKDGKKIKELRYCEDGNFILDNLVGVTVSNVGLFIFRNGLGLLWYELDLNWKTVCPTQLIAFQNRVRELNRGKSTFFGIYVKVIH